MPAGMVVIALAVSLAAASVLGCYVIVRCAEALRSTRAQLIDEAAAFNAWMAAQKRPHIRVVAPPSHAERAVYAAADVLSRRRRARNRHAAAVRVAVGGDR